MKKGNNEKNSGKKKIKFVVGFGNIDDTEIQNELNELDNTLKNADNTLKAIDNTLKKLF